MEAHCVGRVASVAVEDVGRHIVWRGHNINSGVVLIAVGGVWNRVAVCIWWDACGCCDDGRDAAGNDMGVCWGG